LVARPRAPGHERTSLRNCSDAAVVGGPLAPALKQARQMACSPRKCSEAAVVGGPPAPALKVNGHEILPEDAAALAPPPEGLVQLKLYPEITAYNNSPLWRLWLPRINSTTTPLVIGSSFW
jgi:hypothetical protein